MLKALRQIWYVFDFMCAKRLVVVLRTMLPVLDSFGEIPLSAEVRAKLLTISAATIDRLLQPERARLQIKGRTHTKPGSLLKHQIPIRTFADWNEQQPGFFEIDLVGHDGGDASGEFCHTLTLTDVDTGWVELHGLKNKAQRWTHAALQDARLWRDNQDENRATIRMRKSGVATAGRMAQEKVILQVLLRSGQRGRHEVPRRR